MYRLRVIGFAGMLAVIVAACSGGPVSSPSPSATPLPTASPSESAAATQSGVALPSFTLPNNAPELEALLPDEIGGVKMLKSSYNYQDFISKDAQNNQEFIAFLNHLGAQPSDVSVATATPDPKDPGVAADPTKLTFLFAFRVKGADSTKLQDEMKTAMASGSSSTVTWAAQTVGGKQVQAGQTISDSEVNETTYLYTVADIVFAVVSTSPDSAADALSKLP